MLTRSATFHARIKPESPKVLHNEWGPEFPKVLRTHAADFCKNPSDPFFLFLKTVVVGDPPRFFCFSFLTDITKSENKL